MNLKLVDLKSWHASSKLMEVTGALASVVKRVDYKCCFRSFGDVFEASEVVVSDSWLCLFALVLAESGFAAKGAQLSLGCRFLFKAVKRQVRYIMQQWILFWKSALVTNCGLGTLLLHF